MQRWLTAGARALRWGLASRRGSRRCARVCVCALYSTLYMREPPPTELRARVGIRGRTSAHFHLALALLLTAFLLSSPIRRRVGGQDGECRKVVRCASGR